MIVPSWNLKPLGGSPLPQESVQPPQPADYKIPLPSGWVLPRSFPTAFASPHTPAGAAAELDLSCLRLEYSHLIVPADPLPPSLPVLLETNVLDYFNRLPCP